MLLGGIFQRNKNCNITASRYTFFSKENIFDIFMYIYIEEDQI